MQMLHDSQSDLPRAQRLKETTCLSFRGCKELAAAMVTCQAVVEKPGLLTAIVRPHCHISLTTLLHRPAVNIDRVRSD